jgi:hypothetical protein
MATETRLQREPPMRTGPDRRATKEPSQPNPVRAVNGLEHGIKTAGLLARAAETAARGVVEQGVDTAYAVIDEYMTRGRNAAGRYGMSRQYAGQRSQASFGTPGMQLMRMWADWVALFMPGASINPWGNQCAPACPPDPCRPDPCCPDPCAPDPCADPCAPRTAKVEVKISSEARTNVVVDLHSGADRHRRLTASSVGEHRSSSIKVDLSVDPGEICVEIKVPHDHIPGKFKFDVHDKDDCKRGHLWVQVEEPREPEKIFPESDK